MKKLFLIIVLCALGAPLLAEGQEKTKFICTLSGVESSYTTEFATRAECEALCFQEGAPAVCEETGASTDVEDENPEVD